MDLNASALQAVAPEFVAVILSGYGNRLYPLTSDADDEVAPKALLPVGNKPLISHVLSWVEQSGIQTILLICPLSHRAAISHYIHSHSSFSSLRIDIQPYDQPPDLSAGTCTLLRHFSGRIKEDFVLLPVDLIPADTLPLSTLLNRFRTEVLGGAIATACWYEPRPEKTTTPDEWGPSPDPVPVLWEEIAMTLLYVDTPDDVDRDAEAVTVRTGLLSRHPRCKMSASMQDSHVYICRRVVLDALHKKAHFDSFKEEFFPWLCKLQYQRSKRTRYGHVFGSLANGSPQLLALQHSTRKTESQHEGYPSAVEGRLPNHYEIRSATASPTNEQESSHLSLKIGLTVHHAGDGFMTRVNHIQAYMEANRYFLSRTTYAFPSDPSARALIDPKAQISTDSMIGESTRIGEKANVKKCVIGRHCVIGRAVKMIGCVVMDHCTIADGAKLDGCVLGRNTKIGTKTDLLRCVTQANYEVDAGETIKNEKLDSSDWAAGANIE